MASVFNCLRFLLCAILALESTNGWQQRGERSPEWVSSKTHFLYVIGVIAVSRRDIEDRLFRDFEPLVEVLGVDLLDVELTSENRSSVLRATIYRAEGITLDDCASVQRALSDRLDETDPIQGSYTLEVSSPGLERSLRRDKEFGIFRGRPCRVNLFAPFRSKRTWTGDLVGLDKDPAGSETVVLSTPEGRIGFERANVSKVSLVYREDRDL